MQISLFRAFIWLCITSVFAQAYSFTASIDKYKFMVGETSILTLKFCYDTLEEYTLEEPQLQYFKIVQLNEEEQENDKETCVLQHYTLTAQKEGVYTLGKLKAHIEFIPHTYQNRYNKNHYLKKIDIFTKSLSLHISALPHGLHVTGIYQLFASVDKREIKANQPIHFMIKLKGAPSNDPNFCFRSIRR